MWQGWYDSSKKQAKCRVDECARKGEEGKAMTVISQVLLS
jgi:hypothetical protein